MQGGGGPPHEGTYVTTFLSPTGSGKSSELPMHPDEGIEELADGFSALSHERTSAAAAAAAAAAAPVPAPEPAPALQPDVLAAMYQQAAAGQDVQEVVTIAMGGMPDTDDEAVARLRLRFKDCIVGALPEHLRPLHGSVHFGMEDSGVDLSHFFLEMLNAAGSARMIRRVKVLPDSPSYFQVDKNSIMTLCSAPGPLRDAITACLAEALRLKPGHTVTRVEVNLTVPGVTVGQQWHTDNTDGIRIAWCVSGGQPGGRHKRWLMLMGMQGGVRTQYAMDMYERKVYTYENSALTTMHCGHGGSVPWMIILVSMRRTGSQGLKKFVLPD